MPQFRERLLNLKQIIWENIKLFSIIVFLLLIVGIAFYLQLSRVKTGQEGKKFDPTSIVKMESFGEKKVILLSTGELYITNQILEKDSAIRVVDRKIEAGFDHKSLYS